MTNPDSYHVERLCVICGKPFKTFLQPKKHNRTLVYRPARSITCSPVCSRKNIELHEKKVYALNKIAKGHLFISQGKESLAKIKEESFSLID